MIRCACLADTVDTAFVPAEAELLFRFDEPGQASLVQDGSTMILRHGDQSRSVDASSASCTNWLK